MERHDLMALMAELSLSGMRAAYDEVMRDGVKRQRSTEQILGDLLTAEMADKKARSIRYQLGAAKLPLAKTLAEFDFTASPVNETLVRDLHDGGFLKTHMWTAPSLQGVLPWFDQIACVHMSGLLVRSRMNAGQDGFRDKGSKQHSDLIEGHWVYRNVPCRGSIDHAICSFSCKF